jgi:hypothetical protein
MTGGCQPVPRARNVCRCRWNHRFRDRVRRLIEGVGSFFGHFGTPSQARAVRPGSGRPSLGLASWLGRDDPNHRPPTRGRRLPAFPAAPSWPRCAVVGCGAHRGGMAQDGGGRCRGGGVGASSPR